MIRSALKALTILSVILGSAGGALARATADRVSLERAVEAFETAMRKGDYDTVVQTIPPRVMARIAEDFGVDVPGARKATIDLMRKTFEEVELLDFGMETDGVGIVAEEGAPPHAILPTFTLLYADGLGKVRGETPTLALWTDDRWYLLRVDGPGPAQMLGELYPGLEDVAFPEATMDIVEEDGASADETEEEEDAK